MGFLRAGLRLSLVALLCATAVCAQCLPSEPAVQPARQAPPLQIPLVVPEGTPLRVALRDRVRIQNVGDTVEGIVVYPVYAFDQIVIPAGSELTGAIAHIDGVTKKRRLLGIANGDFTPARRYEVDFTSLVLPDGRRLAIRTDVSPGVGEVVRLVADSERAKKRNAVAQAVQDEKQRIQEQVNEALKAVKTPGRWARFKRFMAGMLPFRRQYAEAGTRFDAVLDTPLDFGVVTRTSEQLEALGQTPADESLLEARLAEEVSSATAQQGTPVEAIVTVPLFSAEQKLVFPANSRLVGEVIQASSARSFRRHGQLRLVFKRIELPDGLARDLQANLAGMEVDRRAGLKLDEEGGAEATDPKTKYLTTALAVAVATLAAQREVEPGEAPQTNPAAEHAAGGSAMRLVGLVMSLAVRSHMFSAAMGAYGAAHSVYKNFLSRGREVVLPKGTPIELALHPPRDAPGSMDPD